MTDTPPPDSPDSDLLSAFTLALPAASQPRAPSSSDANGLASTRATEANREIELALPPLGITGTDLASFVLSPSARKLSAMGLNVIGLELIKKAVESNDLRAAAGFYSAMVQANIKEVSATGSKQTSNANMIKALKRVGRSTSGKQVVDVDSLPSKNSDRESSEDGSE